MLDSIGMKGRRCSCCDRRIINIQNSRILQQAKLTTYTRAATQKRERGILRIGVASPEIVLSQDCKCYLYTPFQCLSLRQRSCGYYAYLCSFRSLQPSPIFVKSAHLRHAVLIRKNILITILILIPAMNCANVIDNAHLNW